MIFFLSITLKKLLEVEAGQALRSDRSTKISDLEWRLSGQAPELQTPPKSLIAARKTPQVEAKCEDEQSNC